MAEERDLWEKRYAKRTTSPLRPPSLFLQRHTARLPGGRALDIACGDGRNSLYLAARGYEVDGIDVAFAGLIRAKHEAAKRGLSAQFIQADLDTFPLPADRYDVVLNVRYLSRPLLPSLKNTVRRGGMVVFETFLREQADLGHPRNPAFLLERGELRTVFGDFELLEYEEGLFETETDRAYMARMLARRRPEPESD